LQREELHKKTKKTSSRPVGATTEQLATFKKKRDALRKKEQKKAEVELYGKGGRKGMCGREIILKNIKSAGGVALDAPEDDDDAAGAVTAVAQAASDSPAAAAASASASASTASGAGGDSGVVAAAAAATVGDADVFLEGDDDDLDDLDDDDLDDLDDDDDDDAGAAPAAAVAALP
jgi:hypothetical protein